MEIQVARVILKKCRTYRVGDRRFIKDVPQVIKGDEVDEYKDNGYFHVVMMKAKPADKVAEKKLAAERVLEDDEVEHVAPPKKKLAAKAPALPAKKSGLLKKR